MRSTRVILLVLFSLSGFCSLVYEVLWVRWLGLIVGNFATATALVVGIFMAGLALGNVLGGKLAAGRSAQGALVLYALFEGVLSAVAALSPFVLTTSSPLYSHLTTAAVGPTAHAFLCAAVLLPPTVLMGATLPAVIQALSATNAHSLGPVYSLNMLGAAAGPIAASFLLMPSFGFKATLHITCSLNVLIAAAALFLALGRKPGVAPITHAPCDPHRPGSTLAGWVTNLLAASAGFLALGFEIALTRVFVLTVTGGSVYGFSIVLSAFLLGLAGGAYWAKRSQPRDVAQALWSFALAQSVVWLFALTVPFWDRLPPLLLRLWWRAWPFGLLMILISVVVFLLMFAMTTAAGYSVPILAAALPVRTSESIGRMFAANTMGAMVGALATGFIFLQWFGLGSTILLLGTGALLLAALAVLLASRREKWTLALTVPILAAFPLVLPESDASVMNAGMYNRPERFRPSVGHHGGSPKEIARHFGRIVYQREGLTARVAVRQFSANGLACVVNGKVDGSTERPDMHTQLFMAHMPALTHPNPRNALVIGLGTGITVGSLALHPSIEEIHVVEIEPAQVEVARLFGPYNYSALENPKVRVHLDDARHYLVRDRNAYDLIISEPSNLWVSGMVNLFTREFYQLALSHLNSGGVFFQWLHYYRVSPEDLRGVLRTFQSVLPETSLWLHQFGDAFLLAREGGLAFDVQGWQRRLEAADLVKDLGRIDLDPADLIGFFLWGPVEIARYSGSARVCTDDFPYFEFTTPRERDSPHAADSLRQELERFGPLEPMPLRPETSEARRWLAERFSAAGKAARAEVEQRRALALDREVRAGQAQALLPRISHRSIRNVRSDPAMVVAGSPFGH